MKIRFFNQLRFRQKVHLLLFLLLILAVAILIPLARRSVRKVVQTALYERVDGLIETIIWAKDEVALGERLKEKKHLVFSRAAIIKSDRKVLYDTKAKKILKEKYDPDIIVIHPEVEHAFKFGAGYNERYSKLLQQELIYVARSFTLNNREYVLRTAFPYAVMGQLITRLQFGIISATSVLILLFTLISYGIISYVTSPIRYIIQSIRPYQERKETKLPHLIIPNTHPEDDFAKLAGTLNGLSEVIEKQISILTRERNEKLTILEALGEGIIRVTDHLQITYANPIAQQLLGVHEKEKFSHEEKSMKLLLSAQESQQTLTDLLTLGEKQRRYIQLTAIPLKEKGAVLVLQDMSSHYQALEMTRDFVANASHELKTPITIIRGFSETLQDNPDLSDEQVHFITGKIVSNTIRMTDLIGDLLHLSEIENIEHMELEECDLPLILGDCKAMILEVFPQADMTIESVGDAPFELLSSPQLLEHLFHNLLSNAAKYSEAPAKISIKVSRQGSKFMISIADNGMGIPKESLAHLFTRFYTVDKAHSKAKGGSGLGLAIVQTIVERVGGSISVESELHKGTTFTVILPERPC